jgi:hypothetical protein
MVEFDTKPGRRDQSRRVFALGPFCHTDTHINRYSKSYTDETTPISSLPPSPPPALPARYATLRSQPTTPYIHILFKVFCISSFFVASRLLSEVKHRRARLVLRWGTTLESRVFLIFVLPPHPCRFFIALPYFGINLVLLEQLPSIWLRRNKDGSSHLSRSYFAVGRHHTSSHPTVRK